MYKKIFAALLAAMMLAVPAQTTCFAAGNETETTVGTGISPQYIAVSYILPNLTISSKTATCTTSYAVDYLDYTTRCQMLLEYSSDSTHWYTLSSWTSYSGSSGYPQKTKKLSDPLANYYRVRSVLTVYDADGNQVEKIEATSNVV